MGILSNLKPRKIFEYFEQLCSVPHGSGNTKQISDLCANFAREHGLEYIQDRLNNIIIRKPAFPGYEEHEPVILQGHLDMVCAMNPGVVKDMSQEGLDLIVEGDWLRADGTTLGGDDGIAVAMCLAILDDPSIEAPAIEAVFTVDEETGMEGAEGIDLSGIVSRRMINIDSEEEGVFTVSCAGGISVDCTVPMCKENIFTENGADAKPQYKLLEVRVDGLLGGHSGCEIDKGRGNAHKLLVRFMYNAVREYKGIRLVSVEGGQFDNVICPCSTAVVAVPAAVACHFAKLCNDYCAFYKDEYAVADPGVSLSWRRLNPDEADNIGEYCFTAEDTEKLLSAMFIIPQGVSAMSSDFAGLVETSLNMGVIRTDREAVRFTMLIRSAVLARKSDLYETVRIIVESAGGSITSRGAYPGWTYNRNSGLQKVMKEVFTEQYGREPVISGTHGGLECGLFIDKLKGLDCISVGPELRDIHSGSERMNIPSVDRLYRFIVETLRRL